MAAELQSEAQHVIAIAYPAQGHITPMLELCQRLVPLGFTFTFVNTSHIHQRLQCVHPNPVVDDHELRNQGLKMGIAAGNGNAHQKAGTHAFRPQDKVGAGQGKSCEGAPEAEYEDAHRAQGADQELFKGSSGSIEMVFVEGGSPPEDHAHLATFLQALNATDRMKEPVEKLISELLEERGVAFILADTFVAWISETASRFSLPWVSFYPTSAASFATFFHFAELADQGKCLSTSDVENLDSLVIEGIPGLPLTFAGDIPKTWDATGKLRSDVLKRFLTCRRARFLLFNTVEELEGEVLMALSQRHFTPLAVGPLLPSRYMIDTTHTRADRPTGVEEATFLRVSLFREDRTCLDWLDRQAPSSVLFISFGSIALRSNEQQQELTDALEAVGCPYLWVRKPDFAAGASAESAAGKVEQDGGRGLAVAWAPQLDVLAHPAVGGFLTHCGWNSMVEAMAMGVPMLCWADLGERMSNQRFAVQIWKCALDLVTDSRRYKQHVDEAVVVKSGDLQRPIRRLMVEGEGACIRARAAELRDTAVRGFREASANMNRSFQKVVDGETADDDDPRKRPVSR